MDDRHGALSPEVFACPLPRGRELGLKPRVQLKAKAITVHTQTGKSEVLLEIVGSLPLLEADAEARAGALDRYSPLLLPWVTQRDLDPPAVRADTCPGPLNRMVPSMIGTWLHPDSWGVLPRFSSRSSNSPRPGMGQSAEILARSLVEYAITFAWVAAPSDDSQRADRLKRFELHEYHERERADKKYTHVLPERSELYVKLIESGDMPSHLIDDDTRRLLRDRADKARMTAMPPLLDRAIEADARWAKEIRALERQPLAAMYASAFAAFSFVSHASVTAVSRVVGGGGGHLTVGEPATWTEATGPYGFSISAFVIMLQIASRTLDWPPEDEVMHAAAVSIRVVPNDLPTGS